MIISYIFGQKYYPIKYPLKDIALYAGVTLIIFGAISATNNYLPMIAALAINTILIMLFIALIVKRDLPLGPIIKKIKK